METPNTTNPEVWAKEFCTLARENLNIAEDEPTMEAWFRSAIEAGRASVREYPNEVIEPNSTTRRAPGLAGAVMLCTAIALIACMAIIVGNALLGNHESDWKAVKLESGGYALVSSLGNVFTEKTPGVPYTKESALASAERLNNLYEKIKDPDPAPAGMVKVKYHEIKPEPPKPQAVTYANKWTFMAHFDQEACARNGENIDAIEVVEIDTLELTVNQKRGLIDYLAATRGAKTVDNHWKFKSAKPEAILQKLEELGGPVELKGLEFWQQPEPPTNNATENSIYRFNGMTWIRMGGKWILIHPLKNQ